MKVKELLNSAEKWMQGDFAKNTEGKVVQPDDPSACKWCLKGALRAIYYSGEYSRTCSYSDNYKKLSYAIKKLYPGFDEIFLDNVVNFNDNKDTTFEDVRKVLELADV